MNTLQTFITSYNSAVQTNYNVLLYPVPFSSELNIILNSMQDCRLKVTVLDALGREIDKVFSGFYKNGSRIKYENSGLSKGLYFLRFESPYGIFIEKAIR